MATESDRKLFEAQCAAAIERAGRHAAENQLVESQKQASVLATEAAALLRDREAFRLRYLKASAASEQTQSNVRRLELRAAKEQLHMITATADSFRANTLYAYMQFKTKC